MLCRCGIGTPAPTIASCSTFAFLSKEIGQDVEICMHSKRLCFFSNDLSGASAHDHAEHRSLSRVPKSTHSGCGNFMQTSKVVRSRPAGPGK